MQSWAAASIIALEDVGPDLSLVSLDVPATITASFHTAGQYHRVRAATHAEATFAIASAPGEHPFQYLVRRHGAGARVLEGAAVGASLEVTPVEGSGFPVPVAQGRNLLLVGTGAGFAPLRSVLRVVQQNRARFGRVTALYGVYSPAHLAFRAELDSFAKADITVLPTVEFPDAGWTGRVGRVQTHVGELVVDDAVAFLCGQREMVADVRASLASRGLPADRVFLNV
jgi:NAD(P)H-flavin reductase